MRFNYLSLSVKSKRSQSALEYMMTYGWAILIIVIVAVILYSMGIFNPSSSVTFTSSGFSPFTVNDGEAPQIPCGSTPTSSCSNYAEYDDGANVFNFYDNFAGTTLNTSKWTATGTYSINNGILIKNSSSSYLTSTDSYGGYSNGQQDGIIVPL